jgi:hypothetical protein
LTGWFIDHFVGNDYFANRKGRGEGPGDAGGNHEGRLRAIEEFASRSLGVARTNTAADQLGVAALDVRQSTEVLCFLG